MPRVLLDPEKFSAAIGEIKKAVLDIPERPGHLFTEPRLARRLGYSRYLLRVAVTELAEEKAITMFPRKGFRINREYRV